MATVHTTARGTEPYDKVYCLGYQVHHEDWSPYPRINKLRQTFLDRGYDVDVERLRLVTESYQQHEHLPEKLKVAYAFENVLLHCGIEIYDDDPARWSSNSAVWAATAVCSISTSSEVCMWTRRSGRKS